MELGTASVSQTALAIDEARQSAAMFPSEERGFGYGFGAGVRVSIITLGPRLRVISLDHQRIFSFGGELGLRIPIGAFGICASMSGGYASRGHIDVPDPSIGLVSTTGYYGSLGAGIDMEVIGPLLMGFGFSYSLYAFTPEGVSGDDLKGISQDILAGRASQAWSDARRVAGVGYGTSLTFSARVGVRF
jgi:hypothetical protein